MVLRKLLLYGIYSLIGLWLSTASAIKPIATDSLPSELLNNERLQEGIRYFRQALNFREEEYAKHSEMLAEMAFESFRLKEIDRLPINTQLAYYATFADILLLRCELNIGKKEQPALFPGGLLALNQYGVNLLNFQLLILNHRDEKIPAGYTTSLRRHLTSIDDLWSYYWMKTGRFGKALENAEDGLNDNSDSDKSISIRLKKRIELLKLLQKTKIRSLVKHPDILSPYFEPISVESLLRDQRIPDYYTALFVYAINQQKHTKEAIRLFNLLEQQIMVQLQPEIYFRTIEDRHAIWDILQDNFEKIQTFIAQNTSVKGIAELAINNNRLKKELLDIAAYPIPRMLSQARIPEISKLQQQIDSLLLEEKTYCPPSKTKGYLQRIENEISILSAKRLQIDILRENHNIPTNKIADNWKDIQKLLDPHEAVIEIIELPINFYKRQYVIALYTSRSKEPQLIKLFNNTEMINNFYLGDPYQTFWKKIEKNIRPCTEIYVILDGRLSDYNFSFLTDKVGYLFDRYQIHYLFSTKSISKIKQDTAIHPRQSAAAYLFGGAEFSLPTPQTYKLRGQAFSYLPESRTEIDSISNYIPADWKISQYTGTNANKSNFKKLSFHTPPGSILHLATHGFYLEYDSLAPPQVISSNGKNAFKDAMMRTGFALSGANRIWNKTIPYSGKDNGIMTAKEVSEMNLANIRLAVLSSCMSGTGELESGEGLYGLQRAFKLAGVQSILACTGTIDDEDASLFIISFYKHWAENVSIAQAFRKAQQELTTLYPNNIRSWRSFILIE